jgi:hypothetical protein
MSINDPDDSHPDYQKLDDIWTRGCRGDRLKAPEIKRFAAMARSRFHTFQLGLEHARTQADDSIALGLIRGLAGELEQKPGLYNVWNRLAFSQTETGELVNLLLEKLAQDHIH